MLGSFIGVALSSGIVVALVWDWWRHPDAVAEPGTPARISPSNRAPAKQPTAR